MNIYKKTEKIIKRLKEKANKYINSEDYDTALQIISCIASIYYTYNQKYSDEEIEKLLFQIGKKQLFFQNKRTSLEKQFTNENIAFFYDGFGLNNRGLSEIYLRGIMSVGYNIVYLIDETHFSEINNIKEILCDERHCIITIPKSIGENERAKFIFDMICENRPTAVFLYTYPYDSSGIVAFNELPRNMTRYQINLTDHAFWIGNNAFDFCIEFRDYGASISRYYRGIEENRIIKQPYYPNIEGMHSFKGFPFEKGKEDFVVFSGGGLYKTKGENGVYYKMVRTILDKFEKTKFWYAGYGESDDMDELLKDYPGRAFYTGERDDLFDILKNSDVYLSTFPIAGGLMLQYSARAGVPPLTLYSGEHNRGILKETDECKIIFHTVEELIAEFDKLYNDVNYRESLKREIDHSVITETEFNENLRLIIQQKRSALAITYKREDVSDIHDVYKKEYNEQLLNRALGALKNRKLIKVIPYYYGMAFIKSHGGGYFTESISVFVATYNSDWAKVKRTLISILEQKHIMYEIIVADDGSAENHFSKIETLFKAYNFVHYKLISAERNRGTVSNVYSAIQAAKYTYVKGLGPGDYLVYDTQLSEWLNYAIENQEFVLFGESIYYNYIEEKLNIIERSCSPRNRRIYSRKAPFNAVRTDYLILDDFILALSFGIYHKEIFMNYLSEIVNKVLFAEDNVFRLMLFDGISFAYVPLYSSFYEFGVGVSTQKDTHWTELLHKDIESTNQIMKYREGDKFARKYVKYIKYAENNQNKYSVNIYKYLMFMYAFPLKIFSKFFPAKTSKLIAHEMETFFFRINELAKVEETDKFIEEGIR